MSLSTRRQFPVISLVQLGRLLVPLLVLLIWQALTIPFGFVLATPMETLDRIVHGIENGWLLEMLAVAAKRISLGILIASVAGIIVGTWLGFSEFWRRVYEPFLLTSYSVPKVTIIPFLLLLLGVGDAYLIGYAALTAFFPISILIISGIRSIEEIHLDVATSLRLSRLQTFRYIVVPSMSLPLIIAIRLGFNLAVISVIVAGMFLSFDGIGYQLMQGLATINSAHILAVTVTVVSITVVINYSLYAIERRLSNRMDYVETTAI